MRINSRKKGQRGEKIAIEFMKDWTGMDFKRSPASGGLRGHISEYTDGDVICVKKNYIFPLCIEVKNMAELNFSHLLYDARPEKIKKKSKGIKAYWEQAKAAAKRAEKIPILLMRYTGLPHDLFFVMMPIKVYKCLEGRQTGPIIFKPMFTYGPVIITTTRELKKVPWDFFDSVTKNLLGI